MKIQDNRDNSMYERLFRQLPDAAAVIRYSRGEDGGEATAVFEVVNDAFKIMFAGISDDDRAVWEKFVDPEEPGSDEWLAALGEVDRISGPARRHIYTGRPFNLWIDSLFFPLADDLVAVTLADITKQKRIELALERQRSNLVVL